MLRRTCGLVVAAVAIIAALPAAAQQYPSRTVRLVVPFAAGGTGDIVARVLSERLSQALGQSVVVENRPGATGALGSKAVLSSPPDGHTILVGRSAEENDILSLKLARPRDVFFHVAGQPGSHVIVLVPESGGELDRDTVRFAASLAAAWSSARGARQVSVHYASCADVSKRRGQPPGEVMLSDWKSVRVAPDKQESWKRGAERREPADDAEDRGR